MLPFRHALLPDHCSCHYSQLHPRHYHAQELSRPHPSVQHHLCHPLHSFWLYPDASVVCPGLPLDGQPDKGGPELLSSVCHQGQAVR
ncbi:hypothetical protein FR483_n193R [Paramecium bursaria Chlorella virus FR483]|uniref:Uncharacterized protein n193R n=1 Tax=Paramecium bursaria Chlorella virus FR483 TaxID=399781 RepID=A7J6P7_PBCVF|nr:hypothetical protein FR483_n193R [Paramecium bursaria Chlorella virus FR483]ABT15478.1 hypothetical protein FR483_n193R [Paramecium bursaria Chlorella virus FR483]